MLLLFLTSLRFGGSNSGKDTLLPHPINTSSDRFPSSLMVAGTNSRLVLLDRSRYVSCFNSLIQDGRVLILVPTKTRTSKHLSLHMQDGNSVTFLHPAMRSVVRVQLGFDITGKHLSNGHFSMMSSLDTISQISEGRVVSWVFLIKCNRSNLNW
ncbi:hypothetical protein LINPERHAP2_LOCUS32811 [Linum perenne]